MEKPGFNRRGLSEKTLRLGWDFYIVGRQGVYINHFYVGVPSIKISQKISCKISRKNLKKSLTYYKTPSTVNKNPSVNRES